MSRVHSGEEGERMRQDRCGAKSWRVMKKEGALAWFCRERERRTFGAEREGNPLHLVIAEQHHVRAPLRHVHLAMGSKRHAIHHRHRPPARPLLDEIYHLFDRSESAEDVGGRCEPYEPGARRE